MTGRTPPSLSDCRNGKAPPACVADSVASTRRPDASSAPAKPGPVSRPAPRKRAVVPPPSAASRCRPTRASPNTLAPTSCVGDAWAGLYAGIGLAAVTQGQPREVRSRDASGRKLAARAPDRGDGRALALDEGASRLVGEVLRLHRPRGVDAEIALRARERRRRGDRGGRRAGRARTPRPVCVPQARRRGRSRPGWRTTSAAAQRPGGRADRRSAGRSPEPHASRAITAPRRPMSALRVGPSGAIASSVPPRRE